jgi:2-keto-4-pentenoate hydratase/2-oxohepta-3-ene-1,7-dioic acid hydratase in catechol pathway
MARCKSYSTFAPIGPVIQTELDPSDLKICGYINEKINLQTTTAHMIFNIPQQIAFISRIMKLVPGDVILTGACGLDEVTVGDTVEVEIENIGRLRNKVIAES